MNGNCASYDPAAQRRACRAQRGPWGTLLGPLGPPGSPDASKGEKSTRYHTKRSHMELIRGIFTFFRLLSRREFTNWLGNGGRRAVRGKSPEISVFAHTHTHTLTHTTQDC